MWIIGDSIVRRAERPLNLPVNFLWKGKGGAGVADVGSLLAELRQAHSLPDLLIVHIGTNNLVKSDEFALWQRVAVMLHDCSNW